MSLVHLLQPLPLNVATHGCGLFPLRMPKVREYRGDRILIPDGKPHRAPRKPKASRRRRTVRTPVAR